MGTTKFYCTFCGTDFDADNYRSVHEKYCQLNPSNMSAAQGKITYACDLCFEAFPTLAEVNSHNCLWDSHEPEEAPEGAKCECGSSACGSSVHSYYCPLYIP